MELTLEEAATRLGKSQRQVRYMIRHERLRARKAAGRWLIQLADVPLSEGQSRAAQRKQAALRAAVDEALSLPPVQPGARYSVRNLKAFQIALPLFERAASKIGREHPATTNLKEAVLYLARGCHRYEPADKSDAYRAAREHASVAACELFLLRREEADAIADAVERELLGAVAGLLRRVERTRAERKRPS